MPLFRSLNPNLGSGRFMSGPNDPNKSNETIIVAPIDVAVYPTGLPAGTVLTKITAVGATQGQYREYDPAVADGRQLTTGPIMVLWHHLEASAAAQKTVGLARDGVVNGNLLTYAAPANAGQIAAAEAALATQQVMVRY